MSDSDQALIAQLATGIMMAVRATGVLIGADDATIEHAGNIMQSELKKFCKGEGDYGDALRAVGDGIKPEGHAIAMVVTECVEKIAVYRQTGIR